MSLFDQLVEEALQAQGELSALRPVIEKELLHHDILREMHKAKLLNRLTFIGGTCLRACYGSNRLSEDLDFTGGADFSKQDLSALATLLKKRLQKKYGLIVEVTEPTRELGNVATWKLKIITHPGKKNIPMQRINIDICMIPSYDIQSLVLRNHYAVDMGTQGLLIQAESLPEILADKMVAIALRPNRLKNRDIWDIGWLKQKNIQLPLPLVLKKINDHRVSTVDFIALLGDRSQQLATQPLMQRDFENEMRRFLPNNIAKETLNNPLFWQYLTGVVIEEARTVIDFLQQKSKPHSENFKM